jgi:hypothetical protein
VADERANERLRMAGIALVGLIGAGVAYVATEHVADARLLRARTDAATALAECRTQSATQHVELTAQLASCQLQQSHEAAPRIGDATVDASVSEVSGAAPVARGAACRVELDWNSDPMEGCRALVRCGDTRLYGDVGTGFFDCTVDALGLVHGQDANATSDGGDPRLVVDRATHALTISDDAPAWSVTIALPPLADDPIAGLDGL